VKRLNWGLAMPPSNNHDFEIEVLQRLTKIEGKLDQLVNVPLRLQTLEDTDTRRRGFFKWGAITFGGGVSIVLADALMHILHWGS
jgi:hypothetical protein